MEAGGAGGSQVQIDLDSDDDGEPAGEPQRLSRPTLPAGPRGSKLSVRPVPQLHRRRRRPPRRPRAIGGAAASRATAAAAALAATSPREKPPPLVALIGQDFIVRSCVLEDPCAACVARSSPRAGRRSSRRRRRCGPSTGRARSRRASPPPEGAAADAAPSAAKATVDAMREIVSRGGGSGSEGPPHLVVFSYVPVDEMPAGSAALWQRINDTCKALGEFAESLAPTPLLALVTVTSQSGDPAAAMRDWRRRCSGSAPTPLSTTLSAPPTRCQSFFNLAAAALRPADFAELVPSQGTSPRAVRQGPRDDPGSARMRFHNAHDARLRGREGIDL